MPKSKKRKQTKKNRKKGLKKQSSSKMRQRLEGSDHKFKVIRNPKGEVKMSEVIIDFAEPLLKLHEDTDDDYERAIGMAVICWNLTILPEDKLEENKNAWMNAFFKTDPEFRIVAEQTLDMLLERKRKYFAEIKRFIVDYEVICSKNKRRVNVASTLREN